MKRPSRAAEMREKRARLRAQGLCIRCHKSAARDGRTACETCSTQTKACIVRARRQIKERRHLRETARRYEAAGDEASRRSAFTEAIENFELALKTSSDAKQQAHLCQKIANNLHSSTRPDLATQWYERALERFGSMPGFEIQAARVAVVLPQLCHIECNSFMVQSYFERLSLALERMRTVGYEGTSYCMPAILKAGWSNISGHHDDALHELSSGTVPPKTSRYTRANYYHQMGMVTAAHGHGQEAFANFDASIEVRRRLSSGGGLMGIWLDYGEWAQELGEFDLVRICRDHALLVL